MTFLWASPQQLSAAVWIRAIPAVSTEPETRDAWLAAGSRRRDQLPRLAASVATATGALFAGYPTVSDEQMHDAFSWVHGKPGERLWCEIPAGQGVMGSPQDEVGRNNNERQFTTEITARLWIGATTVTMAQFLLFDATHQHRWGKDVAVPVTTVTWFAATMFCRWLWWRARRLQLAGMATTLQARLPREAEWEYAARTGSTARFWCGKDMSVDVARFDENYDKGPEPSGNRRANDFGLYDMHGNVWEWCQDWYGRYPSTDEGESVRRWCGARSGRFRILRGGSYGNFADVCRSASRYRFEPDRDFGNSGFRVVLPAPELDR